MGAIVIAPAAGDYLTEGKRLLLVLGVDEKGDYACEDAVTEELVRVRAVLVGTKWRVVDRG